MPQIPTPTPTPTPAPTLNDPQFYMISALAFTALAVIAGWLMDAAKIDRGTITSVVTTLMGFSALAIGQFRIVVATRAAGATASADAAEAREAMVANTSESRQQIADISRVVTVTHELVNSKTLALLKRYAELLERVAASTIGTEGDRADARKARDAFLAQQAKQAGSDRSEDRREAATTGGRLSTESSGKSSG